MGILKPKVPKLPEAPDPLKQIELQARFNRIGQDTPFGSTSFVQNPDGSFTQKQTLSPELQQAFQRALQFSGPSQQVQLPDQVGQLAGALAGKLGQRFGLNLGNSPLSLKPPPAQQQPGADANQPPAVQPPPSLPPVQTTPAQPAEPNQGENTRFGGGGSFGGASNLDLFEILRNLRRP